MTFFYEYLLLWIYIYSVFTIKNIYLKLWIHLYLLIKIRFKDLPWFWEFSSQTDLRSKGVVPFLIKKNIQVFEVYYYLEWRVNARFEHN